MWLERKYISMLSGRLQQFKTRNKGFNFRCPVCGDSQTSKYKARGWIYEKKGQYSFHCFNCGTSKSFKYFLKDIDQRLYDEYRMEKLREDGAGKDTSQEDELNTFIKKMEKPKFLKEGPLKGLKKVSQLSPDHRVKKLVDARRIPTPYHAKLFNCPNFKQFTNNLVPDKFDSASLLRDESRLLIPFFDADKNIHAYQGRALGESKIKYITIILDESVPKVYGLDTVDFTRKVYVFEGPIDSMFIPNSIATAGGDLVSAISSFPKEKLVIVYDNEPRNKETVKKLDKAIMMGYNICIWPENMQYKDVNDMILGGLSPEFIQYVIDQNTHRDLAAKLTLSKWSKA